MTIINPQFEIEAQLDSRDSSKSATINYPDFEIKGNIDYSLNKSISAGTLAFSVEGLPSETANRIKPGNIIQVRGGYPGENPRTSANISPQQVYVGNVKTLSPKTKNGVTTWDIQATTKPLHAVSSYTSVNQDSNTTPFDVVRQIIENTIRKNGLNSKNASDVSQDTQFPYPKIPPLKEPALRQLEKSVKAISAILGKHYPGSGGPHRLIPKSNGEAFTYMLADMFVSDFSYLGQAIEYNLNEDVTYSHGTNPRVQTPSIPKKVTKSSLQKLRQSKTFDVGTLQSDWGGDTVIEGPPMRVLQGYTATVPFDPRLRIGQKVLLRNMEISQSSGVIIIQNLRHDLGKFKTSFKGPLFKVK